MVVHLPQDGSNSSSNIAAERSTPTMEKPEGAVLLTSVCILLIIVLGTVESGRVAGANYQMGIPIPGLNLSSWIRFSHPLNATASPSQSSPIASQNHNLTQSSQNPFISFAYVTFLPVIPGWFLIVLAITCFVGACFLTLRLKTDESVIDLEETIKEMELQQKRLAATWSHKLRNIALLRYYLLMKRACAQVGLHEKITETPKEYIERAASFFNVDSAYAAKFARTVNRCRYGEELSGEEIHEASKFMGDFTDVIRRRANAS